MNSLLLARASTAILYLAILSFAAFVITALFLGGDALNGHAENGRYFLSLHGRLTEVSSLVFGYSRYHAIASFALLALAAISVLVSKPSPSEAKWQGRLVLAFIVCSAALSFFQVRRLASSPGKTKDRTRGFALASSPACYEKLSDSD